MTASLSPVEELKQCPFCGGSMYVRTVDCTEAESGFNESMHGCVVVMCDAAGFGVRGCGASGPAAASDREAIAAWNRRTP